MPIEDPGAIDLIVKGKSGSVDLLITDSGSIEDPQKRLEAYEAKLKTYLGYIYSGQLVKDYPEFKDLPAKIILVTPVPMTREMEMTGEVVARNSPGTISVEQQIFREGEGRGRGESEEKKEEPEKPSRSEGRPGGPTESQRKLLIYYRMIHSPEKCRLLREENGKIFVDEDRTLTKEEFGEELESLKSDVEMLGIWKPAAGCLPVALLSVVLTVMYDWKFLFLLIVGYAVYDIINRKRTKKMAELWARISAQMEERG